MEKYIIAAATIVILTIIAARFVAKKRQGQKLMAFAEERGWRYEKSDATILDSYPQLLPFYAEGRSSAKPGLSFGGGRDDDAQDVMYFNAGQYPGHSFTYAYTSYDRDSDGSTSSQVRPWHVVGLELPLPLPQMIIRRRRKLDALESRLTKPIEFSHPGLAEAYTVHAEHPPAAIDIMTPEMAQWLVAEQFAPEMVMQDHRIYVYTKGVQKTENIDPMIAQLSGFLARVPAHVWQKAQGEYPRPERILKVDRLDLGMMKDAYQQWRKEQ